MTLFLAFVFAVLAVAFLLPHSQRRRLRRQLAPHVARLDAEKRQLQDSGAGPSKLVRALFAATERWLSGRGFWGKIEVLLRRGDLSLTTAGFVWLTLGCALLVGLPAAAAGAPALVTLLLIVLAGSVPYMFVRSKANKRRDAFDAVFPDVLDSMAAMLKAGHSFPHAFHAIADEAAPPVSTEFARAMTQMDVGLPIEEALTEMATRVGSQDLDLVATSVAIQRQAGGSLAEFFALVSGTVRERQDYIRRVAALTLVARYSARILVVLPLGVVLLLTVIRYSYMKPLYTTALGHVMLIVAVVLMTLNMLVIRRMARIEE